MAKSKKLKKTKKESALDLNLRMLNAMKKEYLNSFEKRKKVQDEMNQNGYSSLGQKLEALKFKEE